MSAISLLLLMVKLWSERGRACWEAGESVGVSDSSPFLPHLSPAWKQSMGPGCRRWVQGEAMNG